MSEMRVPITDAFDESDRLESVEVELTSKQLDWLREKADERGLSIDHVLRSVITAQIRAQGERLDESLDEPSPRPASGDGQPSVPSSHSPNDAAAEDSSSSNSSSDKGADDGSPSIVDSLRSATRA